jgi:hypothetical protein
MGTTNAQVVTNKIQEDFNVKPIPDSTGGTAVNLVDVVGVNRQLTNAALVSISKHDSVNNSGGDMAVWTNKTGAAVTVLNDNDGSGSILTGTGEDLVLENNASIWLVFDGSSSRWRVVGGSGGAGGGGLEVVFQSTNFTAEAGKHYRCTSGVSAITMPTIADGDQIAISPSEGAEWSADAITVSPAAGQSIDEDNGAAVDEDYVLNLSGVDKVTFTGKASTSNWEVDTPVTPSSVGNGAIVGPVTAETVTIKGTTSDPTTGTIDQNILTWRQNGEKAEIEFSFRQSSAGSNGSGEYYLQLPSGITVDSSRYATGVNNNSNILGDFIIYDNANSVSAGGNIFYDKSNNIIKFIISHLPAANNQVWTNATIGTFTATQLEFSGQLSFYAVEFAGSGTTLTVSDFSAKTKWVDNSVMGATVSNGSSFSYANYQVTKDSNDVYWLEWNMRTNDASSVTSHTVTLTNLGTTFAGSSFQQATVYDQASNGATMNDSANTITVSFTSGKTNFTAYGKGRLTGKPSWFDDNAENNFNLDVHFQEATSTKVGLLPPPTSMDNTLATVLGHKTYSHGTTYNGGNAPTISYSAGGGSISSVNHSYFIPYQTQDGSWRLKFDFSLSVSSTSRTFFEVSVAGLDFANASNISVGGGSVAVHNAFTFGGASGLMQANHSSGTFSTYRWSGDVSIAAKPTWAY